MRIFCDSALPPNALTICAQMGRTARSFAICRKKFAPIEKPNAICPAASSIVSPRSHSARRYAAAVARHAATSCTSFAPPLL